jgi:uncharacterized protein (DUF305 family)
MKPLPVLAFAVALSVLSGSAASANPNPSSHQHHGGAPAPQTQVQAPSGSAGQSGNGSEATRAYMEALDKMHGPMMQAAQEPDPDIAFVKGMIPHHQSAIDMAKVVLQHGKDEQTKKWANDVIREQEREIREMREWLKAKGIE